MDSDSPYNAVLRIFWYMTLFGPRVGHDALFDEVCKFIGLDRKMKALLLSVIKKYQMPYPTKIFLESDALMHALGDPDFSEENADLQTLYDAWFIEQALSGRR